MKLLSRCYDKTLPGKLFSFLNSARPSPLPEITSFRDHARYGPGSNPEKQFPRVTLKECFSDAASVSGSTRSGLFGYPLFTSSDGVFKCWFLCKEHCDELVKTITENPPSIKTIELFDELSNAICLYADCINFIADNPPDKKMGEAANVARITAGNYVEELNTNSDLYLAIRAVSDDPETMATLESVDTFALVSFLHDMEKSGIHLPGETHARYVTLMGQIGQEGQRFSELAHHPVTMLQSDAPAAIRSYKNKSGLDAQEQELVLPGPGCEHSQTTVRDFTWARYYEYDRERETALMQLLRTRHELARSVGYSSYAERELKHTLAGSPGSVHSFLTNLHEELTPLVKTEVEHFTHAKAGDNRHDFKDPVLLPHDGSYYARTLNQQFLVENHTSGDMFMDMLVIQNVMHALNVFCEDILRISLVVEQPMRGELVHSDVIKLGVYDEKEGLIGYVYADIFDRVGKDPRTCLHTITCGMHSQLPVVVLQCGFPQRKDQYTYPRINLDQLRTLFHELGHALHAILGRTKYQHTSGTRGPTDFAEIPSTLFENFISHPKVYYNCIAPTMQFDESHFQYGTQNLFNTPYSAIETETSIMYSMLDQQLHSAQLPGSTAEVAARTAARYSHLAQVPGTAWQQRFSHLNFYGSRYYSYLWSRSIANLIFYNMFYDDPFDKAAGAKLKEFLKRGSSVDLKSSLDELVGYEFGEADMVGAIVEPIKVFTDSYLDKQDISKKWW